MDADEKSWSVISLSCCRLDKKEEEEVEEEEPKGIRRREKRGARQTDEEENELDELGDFDETDSDCDSEETES